MILRSIRLQNWRCFIDEITVGPFSERLNVLHAPNATGKSTLFEALRRGVLDSHRVRGKEVETIRPWGRILAPYVSVEFSHNGAIYRITKRFLDNPMAVLEREENGRFVRLAEGASADEQTRSLFTKNPPGRGLARPENWGLAQILWAPQGDLSFAKLTGDVVEDIKNFLGAEISGAGTGLVEKKIEQKYLKYFTPTGKLRTGKDAPRLTSLKRQLDDAQQRLAGAKELQLKYEELVQKVEELRARRSQADYESETVLKELDKARLKVQKYQGLIHKKKEHESRKKAAEAKFRELLNIIETIKSTRKEVTEIERKISQVKKELPSKQDKLKTLKSEEILARSRLERIRRDQQKIDRLNDIAKKAQIYLENKRKQEDIERRLEKIKQLEKTLKSLANEKSQLGAPDSDTLTHIRNTLNDLKNAKIHIDASLIKIEIVPKKDISATVLLGETPGQLEQKAKETLEIKGSPEVLVEVSDFGTIRASGPVTSVESYKEKKERAEQQLKELTDPFGTCDLNILEERHKTLQKLSNKYSETETILRTLLEGQTVADFEKERVKIGQTLNRILVEHPEWSDKPPDLLKLEKEARQAKDEHLKKIKDAETYWQKIHVSLTSAEKDVVITEERLEEMIKRRRLLESRLENLTSDGKDDTTRDKELKNCTLEWKAAEALLEETIKQLREFPEDPQLTVDKLQKRLEELGKAATEALKQEKTAEGNLAQLTSQGTYSNLAIIEEEIAELSREIDLEEARVLSVRLLYETVSQCRSRALATVIEPVERLATRILRRIAGSKLGNLKVGETFQPVNVIPELSESMVPLENVSGGEREQIYLATRLSLAEVIAKDERQLVVLDDVLTFTDAGRLARVMNILEEAADKLQVLILTCHPERYRGLEDAHYIDLEKILYDSRAF